MDGGEGAVAVAKKKTEQLLFHILYVQVGPSNS